MRQSRLVTLSAAAWLLACVLPLHAGELTVAVASNFIQPMEQLARAFEQHSGHQLTIASGSTGRHYAQIRNGAPFDAFFAADERRPRLLEENGLAVEGSRFTYAIGRLVLWSPRPGYVDAQGDILRRGDFRFLALANPRLAPYGRAAEEVLRARGLRDRLAGRLVRGENIAQAFQFVSSGNAELGFVALSQLAQGRDDIEGSHWMVPQELHEPVVQQAVIVEDSAASRALMQFVRGDEGRSIIGRAGYRFPSGEQAR